MGSLEPLWRFRLKSRRRKIRLRKEDQEKRLLELGRERSQLRNQIRNLGYEPLVPPIQKGWKRIFVLRDDVKRSTRADFFQCLLDKINTVQYSDTREFTAKKRRRGRKLRVPREQKLQQLYDWELRPKKLTEAEMCFFTESWVMDYTKEYRRCYVFNEPWRFVLKVVPNMITEVKVIDSLLEQRLQEIENYLERNHLERKLRRLLDGTYDNGWRKMNERTQYKNPLQDKPLYKILLEPDLY